MGEGVDAASEPGDHRDAVRGEAADDSSVACRPYTYAMARPHDGDAPLVVTGELAFHVNDRRVRISRNSEGTPAAVGHRGYALLSEAFHLRVRAGPFAFVLEGADAVRSMPAACNSAREALHASPIDGNPRSRSAKRTAPSRWMRCSATQYPEIVLNPGAATPEAVTWPWGDSFAA